MQVLVMHQTYGIWWGLPWSTVSLMPACRYIPTGRKSCNRALLSPSRSIRSARTAVWPVSQVPVMLVRHTMLVPGVLKQNFCQSPYLIWRTRLRWPREAISGSRAPGGEACWATARPDNDRIAITAVEEATEDSRGFVQSACII